MQNITTLAAALAISFMITLPAFAGNFSSRDVEVECEGYDNAKLTVYVVKSGRSSQAFVYKNNRLAKVRGVSKSIETDGSGSARLTRVMYQGGVVVDSGISLRIRYRSQSFPGTVGTGHLTMGLDGNTYHTMVHCEFLKRP